MNQETPIAYRFADPAGHERWLAEKYVPSPVDALLTDPERSVVVSTTAGCGFSTSLALLKAQPLLTFEYGIDKWPGNDESQAGGSNHFSQWMATISDQLMVWLRENPAQAVTLSTHYHELLLWLLRRYNKRPRKARSWLQELQAVLPDGQWQKLSAAWDDGELDDLYDDTVGDVQSQIDECVALAKQLGWNGIYALIDISWQEWFASPSERRDMLLDRLHQLLTTLTPLQRSGFGIKLGVPDLVLSAEKIERLIRGRVTLTRYRWSEDDLSAIGRRAVNSLAGPEAEAHFRPELLGLLAGDIASIWQQPGPGAVVALAPHWRMYQGGVPARQQLVRLRQELYRSHAQLILDGDQERRQVWRGATPIALTEIPFKCFIRLWEKKGRVVDDESLLDITSTPANLYQMLSRMRRAIEPFFEEKKKDKVLLYIKTRKNGGAWLEACHFPGSPLGKQEW